MVKPGYKQTEVGVIPEDWDVRKIGDFTDATAGGTPSTSYPKYWNGEILWMSSGELNGRRIHNVAGRITELGYNNSSAHMIPENCVLMGLAGQGKTRGTVAINYVQLCTNQSIAAIFPSSEHNSEYLYQNLRSRYEELRELSSGDGGRGGLNLKIIKNLPCAFPKLAEQERIAGALSDVDGIIATLEKLIAKKKAIKQGAMQELLAGKKRLPGFSGEWKTFAFGVLFEIIPNNAFTKAQMSDSGEVKNIHYGDILTRYGAYVDADSNVIPYIAKTIDLARFTERCYLQSGDIIIADTAEDETVGKALEIINVTCPILSGQHTLLCRPKTQFAEKFLGYYLNASCYHNQLLPFIVGTKVSSVSKTSIAQTKLIVPEYEEQQAIAEILSNMDEEIEVLEQKLKKYHQVKQGMMQQLLTGEIRI